jgi:hypothetical protein
MHEGFEKEIATYQKRTPTSEDGRIKMLRVPFREHWVHWYSTIPIKRRASHLGARAPGAWSLS